MVLHDDIQIDQDYQLDFNVHQRRASTSASWKFEGSSFELSPW